ncbi:MAG: restriction endonuclease subunit S [Eubacteriales bacterium]|jgi:type I restriction enzyme S subunit|nr:restriction endonuclease subunit S [Eubacteriales bacterium]
MSGGLPKNWLTVGLSQVIVFSKGKKPNILLKEMQESFVPYVDIKAFEKGIIDEYADIQSSKLIDQNDVLVVWDGARCGLPGIGLAGAAGSTLMVLKPVLSNPRFLYHFLMYCYKFINSKPKGTGTPHVNPDVFWSLPFPIVPLNEQKRIVAKLDAIMPRIDSVKERLEKIPAILKRFRQSVLTAAVTGKLTEKWREEHPEVESADFALSIVSKKVADSYLNVFEETQTYHLPDTWLYVPLENLGEVRGGGTPSKSQADFWSGAIPWISPKDMKICKIKNGKDFISETALNESSAKIIPTGSIIFVVRGMILAHSFPVALTMNDVTINQDMKGLTPNKNANCEYLLCVFKYMQTKVLSYVKEATHGTLRLEMPVIQTFAIPLPPLEEQKEIVAQVDKLFALADKVEEHYQKAWARVDALSQSVLAKAFRGELVPQDPDDEPAEKLLQRIREEKEKMENELKTASRSARGTRRNGAKTQRASHEAKQAGEP